MDTKKKILFIAICLCAVSCKPNHEKEKQAIRKLPFYNTADFTPQWIESGSALYDSIHTIPAFAFINQDGKAITEKTVAGKIYVADFFFTSCPGICKRLTTNMALVQNAYKDDAGVLLVSHSVTPENDSIPRLKQYANSFGVVSGKWHLVTGNRDRIYNIARRAYFADEDMGEQKSNNDFLHTENLLLIDTHRRIRGVYKGTSVKDVDDLIADIQVLKREE